MGPVPSPDLNGTRQPLLKIFEWARWEVKPEELELLKPSIQLASNLVRVGMPYIATFLPPRDGIFKDGALLDKDGQRTNLCPTEIPLKQNPSEDEIAAALDALEELAPSIRWQTNYEMWGTVSGDGESAFEWMGVTRLVNEERPWGVIDPESIEAEDAESMRNELNHRPLIIGIMGEYVNAIKNSRRTSEEHLRATFMAGITMAHEVAHAILHRDFRSYNPPALDEPYIGQSCSREVGIAFITWIFDGFHPNAGELDGHSLVEFTAHLSWVQHYTVDIDRRPLYKTLYSISVPYIQEKLTQSWWDSLPLPSELVDFSSKAKERLKPIIDPNSSQAATARHPEWAYSWMSGTARWKSDWDFRKPGFRATDKLEGISEEEVAWQKARQPLKGWEAALAALPPSELKDYQRRYRNPGDNEDDEEIFGVPVIDDADIGGLVIDDGMVEKDVFSPLEDDTSPLTRIVVRYLPSEEASTKRPRVDEYNNDGDHNKRTGKKPRLGSQHYDHGSSGDEADPPLPEKDRAAEKDANEKASTNPESWPLRDLKDFCWQQDLPETGTKTSLITRVKRYLKERASGRRASRPPQRARTDSNGFEVYIFHAILGQSSVAALKSALLTKAGLPPEATLTLYFRNDYGSPLGDHEPLSKFARGDWHTLRLKVARSSRLGPGTARDNPIVLDAEPGVLQRELAVLVGDARPTFSELLSSVGQRAVSLDRAVQAGGRFADRREPRPATSGLSVLGEMEDQLEDEETKIKNLKALMAAPRSVAGQPEDRSPPVGTSHMADLFRAANRKHDPHQEEEE